MRRRCFVVFLELVNEMRRIMKADFWCDLAHFQSWVG